MSLLVHDVPVRETVISKVEPSAFFWSVSIHHSASAFTIFGLPATTLVICTLCLFSASRAVRATDLASSGALQAASAERVASSKLARSSLRQFSTFFNFIAFGIGEYPPVQGSESTGSAKSFRANSNAFLRRHIFTRENAWVVLVAIMLLLILVLGTMGVQPR